MRWLLEHGADPNVPSGAHGEAPLHVAAARRAPEVAAMLLDHGADPKRRRADGRTPWALASRAGNAPVLELFAARGVEPETLPDEDALLAAAMRGDLEVARALLARHPDWPAALPSEPRAALAAATMHRLPDAVRTLVALGFDP